MIVKFVLHLLYQNNETMKITIRTTHAFADLKVDEIETTVFYKDQHEVKAIVDNLLDVASQLCDKSDLSFEAMTEFYK